MAETYQAYIQENTQLSPNMRQLVLSGSGLSQFPAQQESGYVKLLLTAPSGKRPQKQRIARSFTIRAQDKAAQTLTLQVVDHGDLGPASRWARRSTPGDRVELRGPGERKLADPTADWYLFGGDMSALPAIAVNLEQLPHTAVGYAFLEIISEADKQSLLAPPGIEIKWIVNSDLARTNKALAQAVVSAPWRPGAPYGWFAGEFDAMRTVRRYFRDERRLPKGSSYVSSYWKLGATDEEMKAAKRADPEA